MVFLNTNPWEDVTYNVTVHIWHSQGHSGTGEVLILDPLGCSLATLFVLNEMSGLQPRCSGDNSSFVSPLIKCLEYIASKAADCYCVKLFTLTFTGYLLPISITWDFYRKWLWEFDCSNCLVIIWSE